MAVTTENAKVQVMGMQMAKASEQDLDAAMHLCSALDALSGWRPVMPEGVARVMADSDADEAFDPDDHEQCARVVEHLLQTSQAGSIARVVWGCAVMLDPRNQLIDPNSDVIELHPQWTQARRERDELQLRLADLLRACEAQPWAQGHPAVLAAQQALQPSQIPRPQGCPPGAEK